MTYARENQRERLIAAFREGAEFLKQKCHHDGWYFSSNFLREYARCSTGEAFSNSESPDILRAVKERYPELRHWIETAPRKGDKTGDLFE